MNKTEKQNEYPLMPSEAFRCMPQPNQIKVGKVRKLFGGGLKPDAAQKKKIDQFEKYIKHKGYTLDSFWTEMNRLKFIQSAGFNIERAYKDIADYSQWRARAIPPVLTPKTIRYLNQGIFYMCGRDCRYRPILVYNLQKIVDNKIAPEQFQDATTYFFDYIINNCLIDGQIQTWVSIIDVNFLGLFSFASELKSCISFLSKTFKCRMHSAYIIRTPSSIGFMWGIAKRFMDEVTISKISLYDTDKRADKLFEHCNPSQIERKYGGDLDQITSFWPPRIISTAYELNSSNNLLVSVDQYKKMYELGELADRKVDMSVINKHQQASRIYDSSVKQVSPRRITTRGSITTAPDNYQNNKVIQRVSSFRGEHKHVTEHQQLLRYQHPNQIILPSYELPDRKLPPMQQQRKTIMLKPPTQGLYIAKPTNHPMSSSAFLGMNSILSPKFHSHFPRNTQVMSVTTFSQLKSTKSIEVTTKSQIPHQEPQEAFDKNWDEPTIEDTKSVEIKSMNTHGRKKYFQ